jgi:pyrophosphatase PpaX
VTAPAPLYSLGVIPRPWAVLLDLDGTLVDTVPFILASVRHAFAGRARRPTDAEWIAGIGTPLRVQLQAFSEGADDLEALVARYRMHQREHHDRMTGAYPGAVDAVRRLHARGHPIGIVTGKLGEPAERSLRHVGLAPYVGALVAADHCPRHKPDPEPVLLALERLGRAPGEGLFVGDSTIDVAAGNAAGVVSVGATWGACSRATLAAAGAAHLLDDVAALPALVEAIASARTAAR